MINFLQLHWLDILFVLIVLAIIIFLYVKKEKKLLMIALYTIVTEMEKKYGRGTGELKRSSALLRLYAILPALFKHFVPLDRLINWIENALVTAKIRWEQNSAVKEYLERPPKEEV